MEAVVVKKVKRQGQTGWIFKLTVAKKELTCDTVYKSERSAQRAGENFLTRYIKES